MPRISLWNNGRKSADYRFTDRTISEFFGASGTGVFVHLYLGVHDQTEGGTAAPAITDVQDFLYLENRDRHYSKDVYELRGSYQVQDVDFDFRQFGAFLANDTIFIEFHLNDMVALLGRKLMTGDVLELPHLRDEDLLDGGKPTNKFYVVEEAMRASSGYGTTWLPHIWRARVAPMTAAPEYDDILQKETFDLFGLGTDESIADLMTTAGFDMKVNTEVVEAAIESVKDRNFETSHFYVIPGTEQNGNFPWIFGGDGKPPNDAVLAGSGSSYPENAANDTYFLRTDYDPPVLFKKIDGIWRRQEVNYRLGKYSAASRLLEQFFNNTSDEEHEDGSIEKQRQSISKVVRPKADW